MALKLKYSSKAEIPAELVSLYAEGEGGFVLDVDGGAVPRASLDEFRQTNISLTKQLAELTKRFEGVDPEAVKSALETKRKLEEGELLKKGDFESVLQSRLAPLEKRAKEAEARLSELLINQGAIAAAQKRGLRATAMPDLTLRAQGVFRVINGKAVAVNAEGEPKVGKDGLTPLSFEEWAEGLVTEAPHLFESSSGGGAAGGLASSAYGERKNPFRTETWNLTEQMKLMRSNPTLAEQLKAAAGAK